MINFRKALLLLFILFLISVTSAQKFDRGYLRTSNPFDQEIDTNPILLGNYPNIQNASTPGPLKLDSIHTFSVTGSEAKWIYDFDDNGRLNSKMTRSYANNTWDNWLHFIYTYDTNDNLLTTHTKHWVIDKWVNDMLETYTYNTNGNVAEHLSKDWTINEWVNIYQASYFYDSNENLETLLYEKWKDTMWVIDSRLLYSNPVEGNPESLIYERWNGEEWEKLTQSIFMYNDNNKLANTVVGKWNGTLWKYYLQAIFEYNANGNLETEFHQIWNEDQWKDDERYSFIYNTDNYFTNGHSEMWDGTKWIQFDGMFSFTNPDGFTEHLWTYEAKAYYTPTTDVEDENDQELNNFELSQNYPNPFNPSTTIKYTIPSAQTPLLRGAGGVLVKLKVYDILGREVATLVNKAQKPGKYEVQFDASHLNSGIYFYRLQSGVYSLSRKMILIK